jgi:hypothetical protein
MIDIFDEVDRIAERSAATTYEGDDIFDEVDQAKFQELPSRMEYAKRKTPEQAAKHYKVSDDSGLPVDYVERNEDKATAEEFDYDSLRKRAPLLANMLRDQRNADLAQQELDNLSWFEEAARETKNVLSLVPAATYSIGAAGYATLATFQSALEAIPQIPTAITAKTQELLGFDEASKKSWDYYHNLNSSSSALLEIARGQTAASKSFIAKPNETRMHHAVVGGIQSAITNAPAITASVLTRNPNVGLSLMGGVSYGTAYIEAKDRGLDNFESMVYGINNAVAEVVTEKLPLGTLLSDIDKSTGFTKMLGRQMLTEGMTEQVATVWQDAVKWGTLNPDKTLADFIAERPDAAYNTMISTIVATGLQTSAIAGLNKITRDQEEAVIADIVAKANESNYRNLDKENFETYLQEIAEENGSIENLYIDAESAASAMEKMNPDDDAYRLINEQLDEAREVNGDIVIPIGEFASTIAPSDNYLFLKDFVRITPDAGNVTINAFDRIQEANKSMDKKDESKRIYKEVFEQLKDTGKLNQEQARLSAEIIPAFLGANPERMGLTVEEAYELMGLKIVGPQEEIDVKPDEFTELVESLKKGEDTEQTQQLSVLLELQGIDPNQDTQEIIKSLKTVKEFRQPSVIEEVVKSDPLAESQEWREKTVTATLDDGSKQEINAGDAYDIIAKRKENAQSILDCINANP